jgi:hypothetical protein
MAKGGNGRLEEAMALLINNQAAFVAQLRETDKQMTEIEQENRERFVRIEERFARIETLLLQHNCMLEALPDALRKKIGFTAE